MKHLSFLLVSIGLVAGCLHRDSPPDPPALPSPAQLRLITPSRVIRDQPVNFQQDSQASTDTPPPLKTVQLDWKRYSGQVGVIFRVYYSSDLKEWTTVTNVSWPSSSVEIKSKPGFFYVRPLPYIKSK